MARSPGGITYHLADGSKIHAQEGDFDTFVDSLVRKAAIVTVDKIGRRIAIPVGKIVYVSEEL